MNKEKSKKELIKKKGLITSIDTSETFTDSSHIGLKEQTMIKLLRVNYSDSSKIYLKFFRKNHEKWNLSDEKSVITTSIMKMNPIFKDFNNDGFNDIIIETATSGRGGNEIQTLYLFQPKTFQLKWIKNSEDFPNLEYNSELNCVNSWVLTGGVTTFFLKIKKDSLIEFAEVDQRDGRIIVSSINKNGQKKEIQNIEDKGFSDFAKFRNYIPLLEE